MRTRARATRAMHRRTASAAAVLLLLLLTAACTERPAVVAVGEPVPAFAAPDLDGRSLALHDLRGDVVLLNIWATWCFPCRREMPAFEQVYRDLAPAGLRILAVSIDAAGATRDIRDFIDEFGLTFDILHDPARDVTRTFRTTGVPETFLIGADGRLLHHWIGRIDPRDAGVRGSIDAALGARATALARSSQR